VDKSGSNAGERLTDEQAAPPASTRPEMTELDLKLIGVNPYAVELLVESFYRAIDRNRTTKIAFSFRGVWIALEVDGPIDTRRR
jgi:hypothetical protein